MPKPHKFFVPLLLVAVLAASLAQPDADNPYDVTTRGPPSAPAALSNLMPSPP